MEQKKRIMLEVAYDGTEYCGWQVQPNGITVEEVLNHALTELLKEEITVIGASRTDSGVHALGNVAVFDTCTRIPAEKICFALNQHLPENIRIQVSREVHPDFHPRYCNSRKTYQYRISNHRMELPTERFYSYFVHRPLNMEAMKEAALYMVGEHDFASFCSAGAQVKTTVRTIYRLDIEEYDNQIRIEIEGNGFLYNMVRIIVGTLLQVGWGMYSPEHVKEILEAKDRNMAGPKVPAKGLRLQCITYDEYDMQNGCIKR